MSINIPTLSYELNNTVRKHREAKGYTQEEFAFLIGKPLKEVQLNEDLTSDSAYDINYTNFYGKILEKKPKDMFFEESFDEAIIKISAKKMVSKKGIINYKGTGTFNKKATEIESYSLPLEPFYDITKEDETKVLEVLDCWLRNGYFKTGVTGYSLYNDMLEKHSTKIIDLPKSFRPILVARALTIMSNRRKKPKLLPQRQLPKTDEKWLLYKEDL